MLKKILIALSLSFALACGGTRPPADPPVTPPVATVKITQPTAPPATELSATLKPYTNAKKGWSISLPDNMTPMQQTDDKVQVKAEDGSLMAFIQVDSTVDTETLTTGTIIEMMQMGERPVKATDAKVGDWDAKIVVFHAEHAPDVKVFTLFATGTHAYAYIYMGVATHARSQSYLASLETIVVSDKPVKAKTKTPAAPSSKKTTP